MHSIRRSCISALQPSSSSSRIANGTRRAFSRSAAHHKGALPVFLEPSNPDLLELYANLNSRVLLPQQLTKEQQDLVYKKANRAKLDAEPIEITLGDVTLPLQHIDRNRDQLNQGTQFRRIVHKSETSEDWDNVVRMVEGYESAGIHLKPQWKELVIRKLGEAGQQHLILKLLQRVSASGFRLRRWGLLREVLLAVHDKAALVDWEKNELIKAQSLAEQIVELMEDKEHCGKSDPLQDLRRKPAVIALPLEMAAQMSALHGGSVEKVQMYANRLMAALKQDSFISDDIQQLETLISKQMESLKPYELSAVRTKLCLELSSLIVLWKAIQMAQKVLGENMPMAQEAKALEQRLHETLTAGEGAVEKLDVALSNGGNTVGGYSFQLKKRLEGTK